MKIKMTRVEICDILNVTNNNLKFIIKNNKLGYRLELIGYKLENQYKVGRNTVYELSKIDTNKFKSIQNKHKIIKKNENEKYVKCRLLLEDGIKMSKRQIIRDNDINIDEHTAKRYDDFLLQEKAIKIVRNKTIKTTTINAKNVVYKMLDENGNILYIGRSNELRSRIHNHSMEEKEDNWFEHQVTKIEYVSFEEYGDCSIVEIYFIAKLKPKYNKDFINWNISINIPQLDELKWKDVPLNYKEIQVYDKGEKYEEFIKSLGVDR